MKKFILFLLALILLFPFQDANAARKRRGGRKTSQHHSSNQKKRRGGKRKSVRKQRGRRRGRGSRDPIIKTRTIANQLPGSIPIIPQPNFYSAVKSKNFNLDKFTVIKATTAQGISNAEVFNQMLFAIHGIKLPIVQGDQLDGHGIFIDIVGGNDDHYKMTINQQQIRIIGTDAGTFYGLQSVLQMIPLEGPKTLPSCKIEDQPRFAWRGMHLDVGRHFYPVSFIKEYIDLMSMYKLNTFHWHLTEDQGWRIEIKKYPKLTTVGGYRDGTLMGHYREMPHRFDSVLYGGFYTQEDIKEVVAYAAKRHINIVPEIEMPGHSMAAIAAYPEYSCNYGPHQVQQIWGVFDDVYCAKDSTIQFLKDILDEVCVLFPSNVIHIGGDECPKTRWKTCPNCQSVMKREGLKDEHELQSYFIRTIEKYLNSKGKKIIGWDEILEGGLAPNAMVMSWRGESGGIAAAQQQHFAVMSPGSHCYFDHYQGNPRTEPTAIGGYTTIDEAYSYNPIPDELNETESKYILGAQGNVWTEYMKTEKDVEYMALPRMAALAEVVWTNIDKKTWPHFRSRLTKHLGLLDRLHVNYSKALYEVSMFPGRSASFGALDVNFKYNIPSAEVRYTVDGSDPTFQSDRSRTGITISEGMTVKARLFQGNQPIGPIAVQPFEFSKATCRSVRLKNQPDKQYSSGGAFTLVDGIIGKLPWYGKDWLGFKTDFEATLDMGYLRPIQQVDGDFLDETQSWIHLPKLVQVYLSADGINYQLAGEMTQEDLKAEGGRRSIINVGGLTARFVKIVAFNEGKIPEGMPGAGEQSWLFIDEILVD
jgi:hexosaminidase